MKKQDLDNTDVIIIQKQTSLERYTKRILNIDFLDYINQDSQSKDELNEAHETHVASRKILISTLKKMKLNFVIMNLDELKENCLNFFNENIENSSLSPKKKLVISLGGDGTLLHASHYIGGDVKLLGINSCPKNSVGHLCAAIPNQISQLLEEILVDKKYTTQLLNRLRVQCGHHKNIPLALNDVLVSHMHPAATSRYQLSILSKQEQPVLMGLQLSSGVWISTAAGSTAAISSYGFDNVDLHSKNILVATREPYLMRGKNNGMNQFVLDGQLQSLSFFSRMRQGIVCLDGSDFSIQFGFGETIEISSPDGGELLLILRTD